jgi:hypothetical protein
MRVEFEIVDRTPALDLGEDGEIIRPVMTWVRRVLVLGARFWVVEMGEGCNRHDGQCREEKRGEWEMMGS